MPWTFRLQINFLRNYSKIYHQKVHSPLLFTIDSSHSLILMKSERPLVSVTFFILQEGCINLIQWWWGDSYLGYAPGTFFEIKPWWGVIVMGWVKMRLDIPTKLQIDPTDNHVVMPLEPNISVYRYQRKASSGTLPNEK